MLKKISTLFSLGVILAACQANTTSTTSNPPTPPAPPPVACTEEAKLCPDGSAVSRVGPNCEFAPCPDSTSTSTTMPKNTISQTELPEMEGCHMPYEAMIYPAQLGCPMSGATVAKIATNHGDVWIQLFPDKAPKAVENFIGLAEKGYYDNLIFHRVIPDFMIQGGDPTGTGRGGQSLWGKDFADEFDPDLQNLRGALSMANRGPGTNGSQFFIVQKEGGTSWLNGKHTVFGQVFSGMDVVDEIANVKAGPTDKPLQDVAMEKVEVFSVQ